MFSNIMNVQISWKNGKIVRECILPKCGTFTNTCSIIYILYTIISFQKINSNLEMRHKVMILHVTKKMATPNNPFHQDLQHSVALSIELS